MRTLSLSILFLLLLSTGGSQLLIEMGKSVAKARALRFQKMRSEEDSRVHWLTLSPVQFQRLKLEDVGHGVKEFEWEGWKYDAFEITPTAESVLLLVKRDNLDTRLNHIFKSMRRYALSKCLGSTPLLYNILYPPTDEMRLVETLGPTIQISSLHQDYSFLIEIAIYTPPWKP